MNGVRTDGAFPRSMDPSRSRQSRRPADPGSANVNVATCPRKMSRVAAFLPRCGEAEKRTGLVHEFDGRGTSVLEDSSRRRSEPPASRTTSMR
jgi:hypothetical protein